MKKDIALEKNNSKVSTKIKIKNNNKKIYTISSYILLFLSLILVGMLWYINVLPIFYYLLVLIILSIINIVLLFFLNHKKIKKGIKKKSFVISLIFIFILLFGNFMIIKTYNFLSIIKSDNSKTLNYSVITLSQSKYNTIDDLVDSKMGYYNANENANANISTSIKFVSYTDLNKMYTDLFSKKISSIVIEDSLKSMLEDANDTYSSNTKVVYTFSIVEETNAVSKNVDVTKATFNLYISGIDTYGAISSVSRSDVNIVATINPKTKKILLTSIPRDYYVSLYGKTGYKDKLTHAGIYGVDESISTIENLLGIDINYYIKVNFTSVVDIVDTIGGLNVYSDYAFTSMDGYNYKSGYNMMYGAKTLSFARERHAFEDGDRQRGKNQEAVIKALVNKITSPTVLTKYDTLLSKLSSKIETNMTQKEILSLIRLQLNDNSAWTIDTNSLDGSNSMEYTYSYSSSKLYVMIPDEDSIANAKNLISKVGDE